MIASGGDESGRLLELPTGLRDGTSAVGNFSAMSQFYQDVSRSAVDRRLLITCVAIPAKTQGARADDASVVGAQ